MAEEKVPVVMSGETVADMLRGITAPVKSADGKIIEIIILAGREIVDIKGDNRIMETADSTTFARMFAFLHSDPQSLEDAKVLQDVWTAAIRQLDAFYRSEPPSAGLNIQTTNEEIKAAYAKYQEEAKTKERTPDRAIRLLLQLWKLHHVYAWASYHAAAIEFEQLAKDAAKALKTWSQPVEDAIYECIFTRRPSDAMAWNALLAKWYTQYLAMLRALVAFDTTVILKGALRQFTWHLRKVGKQADLLLTRDASGALDTLQRWEDETGEFKLQVPAKKPEVPGSPGSQSTESEILPGVPVPGSSKPPPLEAGTGPSAVGTDVKGAEATLETKTQVAQGQVPIPDRYADKALREYLKQEAKFVSIDTRGPRKNLPVNQDTQVVDFESIWSGLKDMLMQLELMFYEQDLSNGMAMKSADFAGTGKTTRQDWMDHFQVVIKAQYVHYVKQLSQLVMEQDKTDDKGQVKPRTISRERLDLLPKHLNECVRESTKTFAAALRLLGNADIPEENYLHLDIHRKATRWTLQCLGSILQESFASNTAPFLDYEDPTVALQRQWHGIQDVVDLVDDLIELLNGFVFKYDAVRFHGMDRLELLPDADSTKPQKDEALRAIWGDKLKTQFPGNEPGQQVLRARAAEVMWKGGSLQKQIFCYNMFFWHANGILWPEATSQVDMIRDAYNDLHNILKRHPLQWGGFTVKEVPIIRRLPTTMLAFLIEFAEIPSAANVEASFPNENSPVRQIRPWISRFQAYVLAFQLHAISPQRPNILQDTKKMLEAFVLASNTWTAMTRNAQAAVLACYAQVYFLMLEIELHAQKMYEEVDHGPLLERINQPIGSNKRMTLGMVQESATLLLDNERFAMMATHALSFAWNPEEDLAAQLFKWAEEDSNADRTLLDFNAVADEAEMAESLMNRILRMRHGVFSMQLLWAMFKMNTLAARRAYHVEVVPAGTQLHYEDKSQNRDFAVYSRENYMIEYLHFAHKSFNASLRYAAMSREQLPKYLMTLSGRQLNVDVGGRWVAKRFEYTDVPGLVKASMSTNFSVNFMPWIRLCLQSSAREWAGRLHYAFRPTDALYEANRVQISKLKPVEKVSSGSGPSSDVEILQGPAVGTTDAAVLAAFDYAPPGLAAALSRTILQMQGNDRDVLDTDADLWLTNGIRLPINAEAEADDQDKSETVNVKIYRNQELLERMAQERVVIMALLKFLGHRRRYVLDKDTNVARLKTIPYGLWVFALHVRVWLEILHASFKQALPADDATTDKILSVISKNYDKTRMEHPTEKGKRLNLEGNALRLIRASICLQAITVADIDLKQSGTELLWYESRTVAESKDAKEWSQATIGRLMVTEAFAPSLALLNDDEEKKKWQQELEKIKVTAVNRAVPVVAYHLPDVGESDPVTPKKPAKRKETKEIKGQAPAVESKESKKIAVPIPGISQSDRDRVANKEANPLVPRRSAASQDVKQEERPLNLASSSAPGRTNDPPKGPRTEPPARTPTFVDDDVILIDVVQSSSSSSSSSSSVAPSTQVFNVPFRTKVKPKPT